MTFDPSRPLRSLAALVRRVLGRTARRRGPAAQAKGYVNRIVSDAILFNETPSPTENERERAEFIARRLNEFGISELTIDGTGSVGCTIPSSDPTAESILMLASTANPAFSPLHSLVRLTGREATGIGIADNSLGVAAMLVLAEYLVKEQAPLAVNIDLFFTPMARGREIEGFARERARSCRAALFVCGLHLGDVEAQGTGTCELIVTVRAAGSPGASAVAVVSAIASRLGAIRWSADNATLLRVARLEAGVGLGYFPVEGTMEVEIVSPGSSLLLMARDAAIATIRGTAAEMGATVELHESTVEPPADDARRAALVETLRQVHREMGIRSREVTAAPHRPYLGLLGLPVLSVGITTGRKALTEESVDLAPIEQGFRQLLMLTEKLGAPRTEAVA
jgi:hypothetical protein